MKNTFGQNVSVTLFGESHGGAVGVVIDGLAPGIAVDESFIDFQLNLRRPMGSISTARREADAFVIQSGVFQGKTTGTPICIMIPNTDIRSEDYSDMRSKARPSHADYTAYCKYHGFEDFRGGGHFSGRITAALVAAGAIIIPALKNKGIFIGTHIKKCSGVSDRDFSDIYTDIQQLSEMSFPVLDKSVADNMISEIERAKADKDSVGGILETAVYGINAGIGEPWFDTVEGVLSHALFSIPAIKGVEFGAGFALADMRGSVANDSFFIENNVISSKSNFSGGINGGITNGMPIMFRCVVRPTPTIGLEQKTVDFIKRENTVISAVGRHDPCIVHRARIVIDSVVALVICDMLSGRYGTDWLV